MPVSLKDQVVLIIGASSGIGRETAVLFAREGAHVFAVARRRERLEELQRQLDAEGHRIEIAAADSSVVGEMQQVAERTHEKFGKIDFLVYATGTNIPDRALTRLTPAIWNDLISVNLNGAYYITSAVLPQMRAAAAGYLIYVASMSGLVPDPSGAAYQASKRGMLGMAHAIRFEEKQNGIRTSVICPGLVDTEILEKRPVKTSAETLAKALQAVDVAEAILAVAKLPPRAVVPEMHVVPTYL
jgi:serine 3-dehydrogenase